MNNARITYTISAKEIETNHIGIGEILKFYAFAKQYTYTPIDLNISTVNTLEANLSALILALANKLKIENKVSVFIVMANHHNVFFRNGLIAHLAGKGNSNPYEDNRQSTIPLTIFQTADDEKFCQYLRRDFFGHRGLEALSTTTKTTLSTHFEEIFTNVVLHANSTYPIFTCGQYYPEKQMLKFTLVDLGEGFLKKIAAKTNGEVSTHTKAILWATYNLNTTKDVITFGPGGTGLKEIKNYCESNNGSLHICSGNGYINFLKNKTLEQVLANPFQGSIVNLIFRNIQ